MKTKDNTQYKNIINTEAITGLIIGRVEPHIYAFSTQTVPNYLKVGDTYRPVEQRLNEWRKYFPNLEKQFADIAKVDDETYFRDFAIHYFLENEKHLRRLLPGSIGKLPYYSKEFFEKASTKDIKEAIKDIKNEFKKNSGKYQFYSFADSRVSITHTYRRTESYGPRPNQMDTIKSFLTAIKAGRKNLLMYAVMRFGKSFTSMCCATEMNAKLVIVVSAKADVKEEWKKTVESHKKFEKYVFFDSDALMTDGNALKNKLKTNSVVVFLTLQDLMGDEIKAKHKEIFKQKFDLLIVDESHFGARASEYGKVLNISSKSQLKKELKDADVADSFENNETLKALNAKVRMHLSGTPYRILMGSEFEKEDIIAFYQFTDIVKDQEAWDKEYLQRDEAKEWDNPYYGFPQMIRFAFNPNESAVRKMEELKKNGTTYAFSELFRPQSISKDTSTEQLHRKFVHESEVLDLLKVIDGSKKDKNVLGFLDLEQIKAGKMCHHIVCVLPYRASCDAFEKLLTDKCRQFKNLKDYEIINIAGINDEGKFKDTQAVKQKIKDMESEGKKTLTLTVNRMLTGSTVEEWDTMIYLKDTASPQEYDQAIFRLQNQYIRKFTDGKGDEIKYNMKPQTLLVDFNPNRMLRMQEQKSQIYNVNTEKNGNSKLEDRIEEELRISPIICVNKDRLQQVEPANILDAVREYSANKSVMDEATDIPIDFSLLTNETIRKEIEKQSSIDEKKGIDVKTVQGEGDDMDIPDADSPQGNTNTSTNPAGSQQSQQTEEDKLRKKFATYYAKILFFAFLTNTKVKSLEEIITALKANDNDNRRIARNVGLRVDILKIMQDKCNPFILSKLDYKIQNLNTLMDDKNVQPDERVEAAMKKFGRLSSSEIVTPMRVAKEMVDILPEKEITKKTKILDIASKQGEFTRALYAKFGDKIKRNIYALPTSTLTYEFTRKVYSLLGMPLENVFADFTSYDLIDENKKENIMEKLKDMQFKAVVGNPPYQVMAAGDANGSDPIYHLFIDAASRLGEKFSLIHPARFLFNAGKTPKAWNEKMLNDEHFKVIDYWANSGDVFSTINIMGGVAATLYDKKDKFKKIKSFIAHEWLRSVLIKVTEKNFDTLVDLIYPQNKYNFDVLYKDYPKYKNIIGSDGTDKRLRPNAFEKLDIFTEKQNEGDIGIHGLIKNKRVIRFINKKYLETNENIEKYKVLIPKANGSGAIGEVISTPLIGEPLIGEPLTGYTGSFIGIGAFDTKQEAESAMKYIKTKFARTLLGTLKVTQDNPRETWLNVPLQDFTSSSDIDWSESVPEIDRQLYKKYGLTPEEITFIESMIKPM